MSLEIKTIVPELATEYIRTMFWTTGINPNDDFIHEQIKSFELPRAFGAFEDGKCIGTVGTRTLNMTLTESASASMAAIGQGGVLPTHTRRGIMTMLMEASLQNALEMNEDIAGWTTSEWSIYERYRPGLATYSASYMIDGISKNMLRSDLVPGNTVEMADPIKLIPQLEDLHRKCSLKMGNVPREQKYWDRLINRLMAGKSPDLLDPRSDLPRPLCVVVSKYGQVQGCCIYRIHQIWESNLFNSKLEIIHMMAADDLVIRDLWAFLFKIDLVNKIVIPHAPVNFQLRWLLRDGRRLKTTDVSDHIWIRILRPRSFFKKMKLPAIDTPLIFDIRDDNKLIDVSKLSVFSDGDTTEVYPSSDKADITLGVDTLASIILSSNSISDFYKLGKIACEPIALQKLQSILFTGTIPFTDTSF
jgi:predicted acetyltransferase